MPIYEFECSQCSKISEFSLKLADPYPKDCPQCGSSGLQKLVSRTAFVLQGGGWYNEAYSKKSDKTTPPPAAATESKTSPESKPTQDAQAPAPAATVKSDAPKP